jgi:outer membrane biosynthesis protein TonB
VTDAPRSEDEPQASYLEVALMVFVVLAAVLLVAWLAMSVLNWIWGLPPPICFVVTCSSEPQPKPQTQPPPQPQPQTQPQPQPKSQSQPQAQLPRYRSRPRPHVLDAVIVGECPPLGYWGYYSPRLREPPRRSAAIECWRDRGTRGPCFD